MLTLVSTESKYGSSGESNVTFTTSAPLLPGQLPLPSQQTTLPPLEIPPTSTQSGAPQVCISPVSLLKMIMIDPITSLESRASLIKHFLEIQDFVEPSAPDPGQNPANTDIHLLARKS